MRKLTTNGMKLPKHGKDKNRISVKAERITATTLKLRMEEGVARQPINQGSQNAAKILLDTYLQPHLLRHIPPHSIHIPPIYEVQETSSTYVLGLESI